MQKIITLCIMAAMAFVPAETHAQSDVIDKKLKLSLGSKYKEHKALLEREHKEYMKYKKLYGENNPEVSSGPVSGASTETIKVKGVSFNMVLVNGGSFDMGATSEQGSDASEDEKPVHRVTLSSYYIGETEVTQALWEAVMGNNPSSYKHGPNYPVENVSWYDCQEFIRKLNSLTGKVFRLPTEAEWEFAARGGNLSKGYKYAGSDVLDNVAWYTVKKSEISLSHPVSQKQANELGLYDMSGNVSEWCSDWYGDYSSSSQTNPAGPSYDYYQPYRVVRGGLSWLPPHYCRVADRFTAFFPTFRGFHGLRLVLVP